MGELIPFPVWIIPFPVLKINFELLGSNEKHLVKEVFQSEAWNWEISIRVFLNLSILKWQFLGTRVLVNSCGGGGNLGT